VLSYLAPRHTEAERFRLLLSGSGRGDTFDRLGWPSPKLLVACGAVALCRVLRNAPPDPKNKRAVAFCAALLGLARERAGDSAPAADARESRWQGSLVKARRVYGDGVWPVHIDPSDEAAMTAVYGNRGLIIGRWLVDQAIERARTVNNKS
jgi:hypothetical protein